MSFHYNSPPPPYLLSSSVSRKTPRPPPYALDSSVGRKFLTAGKRMGSLPTSLSVARSTAGSLPFAKNPIELSVYVANNVVFLYPNAGIDSSLEVFNPRGRPTVIVSIILTIPAEAPKPAPIKSLTVRLEASESLGFPNGPFEQNVLTYASKMVEEACQAELLPGNAYRWEVPVDLGNDVTPYERMRFGRVFQKMRVKLVWSNQSWMSKYKDLKVERDVWLTCIPRSSNLLDYARTHRGFVEGLGMIAVHMRTQHLTVGGYLRVGLSLPSLNAQCKVLRFEIFIRQTTTLHSRKRPGVVQECPPERRNLLTVEGEELMEMLQATNQGNWIVRIPFCDQLRPSTLQGSTDAAIRLNHQLEVCTTFDPTGTGSGKAKPLVHRAAWSFILPSCTCRWRSLNLPNYSQLDPTPVPDGKKSCEERFTEIDTPVIKGRLQSHLDQSDCSCGTSMTELLGYEDEFDDAQRVCSSILMREELQSPIDLVRSTESAHVPDAEEEAFIGLAEGHLGRSRSTADDEVTQHTRK
ncbi:hypothetical protein CBS101457_001365 [Exobasidium rhododendri]|nr:hypothetical protein CBS101457_001365 [Exobasidium rhododendri]